MCGEGKLDKEDRKWEIGKEWGEGIGQRGELGIGSRMGSREKKWGVDRSGGERKSKEE